MDIESLTSEVHRRLGASVNVKRREYSSTYYPTAMEVLGVSVPDLRVVVRDVGKRIKAESSPGVMALAHALIGGGTFEGRHASVRDRCAPPANYGLPQDEGGREVRPRYRQLGLGGRLRHRDRRPDMA